MAKEKAKKEKQGKKKKGRRSTLVWGVLGFLIVALGAVAAAYFTNPQFFESNPNLRVVKEGGDWMRQTFKKGKSALEETMQKTASVADTAKESIGGISMGLGGRSHQVQPGENLWAIARDSGLVDNPWEWRTILLQNSDKIDYAFISTEEGSWKIMLGVGQDLTVSERAQAPRPAANGNKYAFQLASMAQSQAKRAVFVVRRLMKDGYYAYLYQHEQDGQIWYRIRSGFYDSEDAAKVMAQKIRDSYTKENYFPDEPWMIKPSPGELSGEDMVFGAQLTHPWILELPDRGSHGDALKDLRKVAGRGHFAYIWQTRSEDTDRFIYRTRIGFFASEDEAREARAGQEEALWEDARPLRIDHFEETLPGQNHKLGEFGL